MMTAKFNKIFNRSKNRKGAVLLIVLIIVMAITIVSLGFLSKTSAQLEYGDNMILHTQMDYLAESALEYAKQKILFPQDTSGSYWRGGQGLQLDQTTNQFFDVNVVRTANCNYMISTEAYQVISGQKTARTRLSANLRLNPAIAYWQVEAQPISQQITINGDVYCADDLKNYGQIIGDAYSAKTVTNFLPGNISGRKYDNVVVAPVSPPALDINNFKTQYYIGDTPYSVGQLTQTTYSNLILGPNESNPAGVFYRDGNIELNGANITGMLVVKNDMELRGPNTVTITAVKNFPALLVGYDISFEDVSTTLNVAGLVYVSNQIDCRNKVNCKLNINGALVIVNESIKNTLLSSITIQANADSAAIQIWQGPTTVYKWSPAAGAVFQEIRRN